MGTKSMAVQLRSLLYLCLQRLSEMSPPLSSFLVSFPGLKAAPSCVVKVFRVTSWCSLMPALTLLGFVSSLLGLAVNWGAQLRAQPRRRSPRLKRRVLYLQGFECSLKVIFRNDLLPLNQSLYPYVLVALSCPSCHGAGTICRSLLAIG